MWETVSSIVSSPLAIAGVAAGFMAVGVMIGIIWELMKPSTAKADNKKPVALHQNSTQRTQNSAPINQATIKK